MTREPCAICGASIRPRHMRQHQDRHVVSKAAKKAWDEERQRRPNRHDVLAVLEAALISTTPRGRR